MADLSDKQVEELEAEKRHDEIVGAIKAIAGDKAHLEELLTNGISTLQSLAQKNTTPDMAPLIAEMTKGWKEVAQLLNSKPRELRVERDGDNLITKIIIT